MTRLQTVLLLGVILIAAQSAYAEQSDSARTEYRVTTLTGRRFNLANALLTDAGVAGQLVEGRERFERTVPRDSISKLEINAGTQIESGILKGALIGVGLWAFGVATMQEKDGGNGVDLYPAALLRSIGAGALIGAVIGGACARWEPVDMHTVWPDSHQPGPSLSLTFRF